MTKFLKYLLGFFLLLIAASLAFCSMGIYNGVQTANRLFAGADTYTCRQFNYDMEHPETDKLAPMILAAVAYGIKDVTPTAPENKAGEGTASRGKQMEADGIEPAIRKVYALCQNKLDERLLNVFATTITNGIVSGTVTGVSSSVISTTTQQ
jgi:hypothetical protein